jgi:glucosyl-dolichyl phosphate glucuronosyltransferase
MLSEISVVICAYDEARWALLEEAVKSIRLQTRPACEIIVVCDHNPALFLRASRGLPGALVVENTQQLGVSGARNIGIALSSGQIIAFLDDDAIAEPDWLNRLARAYDNPAILGVGGRLEPVWASARPAWFPMEFGWVVGCSYVGLPRKVSRVRNLIGANMSVRRDVLVGLGGFRPGFGKVGLQSEPEDTDICIRGQRLWPGGGWLYEPAAVVHHHVPAGRANWRYFMQRCYVEGLGKASMVRNVGAPDGLSSERAYVIKTLPAGIVRGLGEAMRGDWAGVARSAAIAIGLAVTLTGYGAGRLRYNRLVGRDGGHEQPIMAP